MEGIMDSFDLLNQILDFKRIYTCEKNEHILSCSSGMYNCNTDSNIRICHFIVKYSLHILNIFTLIT